MEGSTHNRLHSAVSYNTLASYVKDNRSCFALVAAFRFRFRAFSLPFMFLPTLATNVTPHDNVVQ